MENHNQSNSNESTENGSLNEYSKKHPIIYLILLITIILIILFIICFIEKIIFIILTTITFTKLLSFPLQILLHILFIRYIIIQVAFAGQNIAISNSMLYNIGKTQVKPLYKALINLHDSMSILKNFGQFKINLKELSEMKKNIEIIQVLINEALIIFRKMNDKFNNFSQEQQILYDNMSSLNEIINNGFNNGNILLLINNISDVIKKNNKESLSEVPDEEKDEIISQLSNNTQNIQKILAICHTLMDIITDFIGDKYKWYSRRYIRNFFVNRLFGSIEQLHCELSNIYNLEEKTLITKDKCHIEYIIIKKNYYPKKRLMIICGPNGVPFQIYSRNLRFENYLELNMDVLCWNYRGYGLSKGSPSYSKLRSDVLELFDEVKKNNNYEKYAVHGISIGGIPCCHLARHRKEIELVICDRNFGRLDNIVQSFPCGKILFKLYKFFLFQSTDNIDNYLNINCYKILLNDARDSIVLDCCSLKTLLSMKLCENYFYCNNKDNPANNSILGVFSSHNNELESLSSKKIISDNQNISEGSLNNKITIKNNNKEKTKVLEKKTVLDKIFNSVEEKNKFVKILINVSKIINNDKLEVNSNNTSNNFIINLYKKCKNKGIQYVNLKEEELQNTSGIFDFVKTHMSDIFDSIESAGDTFLSLLSFTRDYAKEVYIDNFFNNMFIWGCKPLQNKDEYNFHSVKNISEMFESTMKLFEEFWNSSEIVSYKGLTLIKDIESLYKYFSLIQNNLKYVGLNTKDGFVKLINEGLIDDDNNDCDYEQCLKKINIGNFVPLHCGHNGALSSEENKILDYFMKKSSFFSKNKKEKIDNEKNVNDKESDDINTCTMESMENVESDENINNKI